MGLAQEVKDFVAGYSAFSEITAKRDANKAAADKAAADKEYRDALLDIRREELELRKKATSLRGGGGGGGGPRPMSEAQRARLELDREKFEWQKKQGADKAAGAAAEAAISGVDDSSYNDADYADESDTTGAVADQPPVVTDEDLEAYSNYAEGGKVEESAIPDAFSKKYGSTAKAPVTAPAETQAPAPGDKPSAIPAEMASKPAPTAPAQTQGEPVNEKAVKVVITRAGEAAAAAMDSFEREVKTKPAAIGEGSERSDMDIASGQGGMTPQEYEEILKTVDPNNTIPPFLKNGAALSAAYTHFIEKGQTDKAVKAAKGFLIANKNATQTLGALALDAFKQGDAEAACRLINDACNRFPSADQIEVQPDPRFGLIYSVKQGGKTVEEGKMNMEQAWELTGKIADGSLYIRQMAQFAKAHKKSTPDSAITASNNAYAELMQTNEALSAALASDSDKSPEEIKALKAKAEKAKAAHEKAMDAAVKAGAKRRDVLAENKSAYEMAIPEVPEEATQPEQPGWWARNAPSWLGGGTEPVTPEGNAPAQAVPAAPAQPAPKPAAKLPEGMSQADVVAQARAAVAAGKDPQAIAERLQSFGIDPALISAGE